MIDSDKRPGLYILTGSQQWSVLKSISESLAGRAVFLDLHGFSLAEIDDTHREGARTYDFRLTLRPLEGQSA